MDNKGAWEQRSRLVVLALVVLVVGGVVLPSVATVAANEDRVTVDAPSTVTAGSTTTIQGTVETKERQPGYEATFVVRLYIDGSQEAEQEVTISDGDRETVSFDYVFESSGEHSITIEAEAKGANPYRDSRTVSITVEPPETPSSTPTRPETATPSGPSQTTLSGAAFAVPESLQDEVDAYRDSVSGTDLGARAFVLATESGIYLVFTDQTPEKGRATVEGAVLARSVETANRTFGGVAAASVDFETTGTERDIATVAEAPGQYAFELVRVTGDYRRTATLTDPDEGNDFNAAETGGVIAAESLDAAAFAGRLGTAAREAVDHPNRTTTRRIVGGSDVPHLWTGSLETKYWVAGEATVDGIVLPSDSPARSFLEEYGTANTLPAADDEAVLYLVDEQYDVTTVETVGELNQQADALDGETVTLTARVYQEQVSVQETLEHSTACGEDLVPVKEACVNVPQDVTLHGGVAWSEIPQDRAGVLPIVAASNIEVDEPSTTVEGRYRLTGEVVATSRINESLPEGAVLFVYEAERTGDIDYEAVAQEARTLLENRTEQAANRLRSQALGDDAVATDGEESEGEERLIRDVAANSPARVQFSGGPQTGGVQSVELRTNQAIQSGSVTARRVSQPPSTIGQPPGRAVQFVNISATDIPDGVIQSATIRIEVSISASTSGELTVYRYHEGSWEALETEVVSETEGSVVLEAETSGFSYFAVSEDEPGTATATRTATPDSGGGSESETTEPSTSQATSGGGPGFTALSAVVGLFASLVIAVRTRRSD